MAEYNLDYFMDNPELKSRHLRAIPTLEMYRFFPPEEEIITIDKSNPHKNYRFIFNGQTKTDFEEEKLNQFYEYESKTKKIDYPSDWNESDTMRILQATDYDIKKAYNNIIENINWTENIPKTIGDKTIALLNSGFMYVHGRDHHFRPVIFVSTKTVKNILGKNYNFDDINKSIIYLMNYVMKYLLIPGQIENWIIFVDFDGVGFTDLGDFQKIITTLSKRRGRVFKNFFVNIGSFLKFSLKTIIKMVSSVAKKTVILGNNELNKVMQLISPDNLEQKYGGNAPNIIPGGNNLFPPIMPNANYSLNGERTNIITPEEYKNICMSDKKPYSICPEYKKIWDEEKALEELNKKKEEENEKIFLTQSIKEYNKKPENENTKDLDLIKCENNFDVNNKKEINEFLKEFEDLNNLDSFEDRKYNIPSKLNINEINSFFNSLKQNQKFL
jgi:hypothetical protein